MLSLTPQQQAVVAHNEGPALVFAVAGAGKTTAMVHRIERLAREGAAEPSTILATSFGRANVRDLRHALAPWPHCRAVQTRTLHALGRDIIKQAQRLGHLRRLQLNGIGNGTIPAEQKLLTQAIVAARQQDLPFKKELDGLDRQDFLDYVDSCKGNLRYASMQRADLPPDAQKIAKQAEDPSPQLTWYLDLYRLFEAARLHAGVVTFADMLMTGWEALIRFPDVLAAVQNRFRFVLVDEFQDINLAQSELLALITQPHRNYMAIGDDDQTIYEWRGASPHYILDFPKRYEARTYLISDNFRCPAAPLVLANRIIVHNQQRQPKRLSLTRGFLGETAVHVDADLSAMSQHIVSRVRALHQHGMPLNEIAVLVRLNAQTPPIEQALISHNVPYRVSQPFYDRLEIKTLIEYGRLAWVEREIRQGKRPLDNPTVRETFSAAWRAVCNRPKRYISSGLRRELLTRMLSQRQPPSAVLHQAAAAAQQPWLQDPLQQFGDDLAWLADNLGKPAQRTLHRLDMRLDYQNFLRSSSGFQQTGEGRAISVATFIDYAKGHGSLLAFMQHIRDLAQQKVGQEAHDGQDAVTLTTIHQAKGLEWPVVMVAQCNEGMMPFLSERTAGDAQLRTAVLAEERRLFYVALTRTQRDLHLHLLKLEPDSQFLTQASATAALADVARLQTILRTPPAQWQAADAQLLATRSHDYHLQPYFENWWAADEAEKTAVAHTVQRFLAAAQAQQLMNVLQLKPHHAELWQTIAPLPNGDRSDDFPGLAALKPQPESKQRRRPARPKPTPTAPQPDLILPGMWIQCDAGWGRIEEILDLVKRPIPQAERTNTFVRYRVSLRPGLDAEPVELDVSASLIRFERATAVFSCARCHRFAASSLKLVTADHNHAAHDGIGAGYQKHKKPELRLDHMVFSAAPPPDSLT